jgi:hypothetical protein
MSVQFIRVTRSVAHPPYKQWAFSLSGGPRIVIVLPPKGCRAATFLIPGEEAFGFRQEILQRV